MRNGNFFRFLGYLIAALYIAGVEYFVGWVGLLSIWREIPAVPMLSAFGCVLASYFVRGVRLHQYFRQETEGQYLKSFSIILSHNAWNNLLPARLGEISLPLLLNRTFQIPALSSVAALFWFRLLDAFVLLSLAGLSASIFFFSPGPPLIMVLGIFVSILLGTIPIFVTLMINQSRSLLIRKSTLEKSDSLMKRIKSQLIDSLPTGSGIMFSSFVLTWLNWVLKIFALATVFSVLSDLSYLYGVFAILGGEVTSILPLHGPGGLGTYAAGMLVSLQLLGIQSDSLLSAAANAHLFLLSTALLGGVFGMLVKWLS